LHFWVDFSVALHYRLRRLELEAGCALRASLGVILGAVALSALATNARAESSLPPGFVYLRDIDPSIRQDIRYATARNFTGRPLPGYGAAECVLRHDAAEALKRMQSDLKGSGLSLKVYDCYRPQRAVNAMAHWAAAPEDERTRRFYPKLDKHRLFEGWIAARSRHSAGIAVDLTLVPIGSVTPRIDLRRRFGDCDTAQRAPDNSLDMGTSFDCFSAKSYTGSSAISATARASRQHFAEAMSRHGFRNYFREWWHFEFRGGAPAVIYDVPIGPR
jgi:D-alanyl-D-alanine dipeptidase